MKSKGREKDVMIDTRGRTMQRRSNARALTAKVCQVSCTELRKAWAKCTLNNMGDSRETLMNSAPKDNELVSYFKLFHK